MKSTNKEGAFPASFIDHVPEGLPKADEKLPKADEKKLDDVETKVRFEVFFTCHVKIFIECKKVS